MDCPECYYWCHHLLQLLSCLYPNLKYCFFHVYVDRVMEGTGIVTDVGIERN
jgi:hypothetical protein